MSAARATGSKSSPNQDIPDWSRRTALLALAGMLAVQAVLLAPQLTSGRADLNDGVFHLTMVERMAQAIGRAENPFDCWVSEWSFGYPVSRIYQPLGHFLVAAVVVATGWTVDAATAFGWARFLLMVALPLSFFAFGRGLGFSLRTSAALALVAPWAATNNLYGVEYGSFVWRGSGLYAQLVGVHLALLSVAAGFRAIGRGRRLVGAGVLVGLALLAHLVYGYMAAVTLAVAAVVTSRPEPLRRAFRLAVIGLSAAATTLWFWAPFLSDASTVNRSVWEETWKWDSYGPARVAEWLLRGQLLDEGRLPVLSLLALLGVIRLVREVRRKRKGRDRATFVLAGGALWLALFAGRALWGPLLAVIGIPSSFHLHRIVGGVQIFLLAAAAVGLAGLWRSVQRRVRPAPALVAVGLGLLVLAPALVERYRFLEQGRVWAAENAAAFQNEGADLDRALEAAASRGGRVYPGLAGTWGRDFRIGWVPIYARVARARLPAVAFLYHSMAPSGDLMIRFDETRESHYRLFNVGAALADQQRRLPGFLEPLGQWGRFRALATSGAGYFDLVDAGFGARISSGNFYAVNDAWLQSAWVDASQHLVLYAKEAPEGIQPLTPDSNLGAAPEAPPRGAIISEAAAAERYTAEAAADRDCVVLFKMTYHPNWRARVDGQPAPTVQLSPGFVGVPIEAGVHRIELEYAPEWWRIPLLLACFGLVAACWTASRRGLWARWEDAAADLLAGDGGQRARRWLPVAGLLLLCGPVMWPLLTSHLPAGHDTFEYLPRLAEFSNALWNGQLPPVWAAGLSGGYGQPFFLFNPPMIYYLGEIGVTGGLDPVSALNLACILIIFASAAAAFAAGRWMFGALGGWLAAAAYVYSPYFHVDLYVRHALAEFAAFPFYPLALLGFWRFAARRRGSDLALGAAAWAAVLYCHLPSALLFSPVVAAAVPWGGWRAGSPGTGLRLAGGVVLGLGLGASIWVPVLWSMDAVSVDTLLEGYLQYANHFVYAHQLIWPSWGYGLSTAGYADDGMSFSLGPAHVLLALAVLWVAWRRRKDSVETSRRVFVLLGLAAALVGITLPGSLWLWDHLPLLGYVEFPWRVLAPVSALLALAIGGLAASLRGRPRLVAACLALLIVPNLHHLAPSAYWTVELSEWTPERIAARGIAVTTRREYQPRWLARQPSTAPAAVRVASGQAEISAPERVPHRWKAVVSASEASRLELGIAWFPGWVVEGPAGSGPAGRDPSSGLVTFEVPPGRHDVAVVLRRTPLRWLGELLTLASLLVALLLIRKGGAALP